MFRQLHQDMEAHAWEAYPQPACGAVFEGTVYRPVNEVADNSRENFFLDKSVVRRLEETHGAVLAIVHTHPSSPGDKVDPLLHTPSAAEMRVQLSMAVPFGIAVCDRAIRFALFWVGDEAPTPALLGRPFRHGVTDCYSVCRDWYRQQRGIVLPQVPRDWNWWTNGLDLYKMGFEREGFRLIDASEAREGDGILFRMRSKVPNHAAVLLDDGWMLHHPGSLKPYDVMRVSHLAPVERWARRATHWLRPDSEFSSSNVVAPENEERVR